MQAETYCCIITSPIYIPIKTCSVNIKIYIFLFMNHKRQPWCITTALIKTGIVYFSTSSMILQCTCLLQLSHPIHIPISSQLFSYRNLTMNTENTFNIDIDIGWLECFVILLAEYIKIMEVKPRSLVINTYRKMTQTKNMIIFFF